MQIAILNSNETDELNSILTKNYSCEFRMGDYLILKNGEEIYLASKELSKIDMHKLRIDSIGSFFGRLKSGNRIRLSVEGCQMVGKTAKRNIAIIDDKDLKRFMEGFDVGIMEKIECDEGNFVLAKYNEDFIGTGLLKQNRIENNLPKSRRIFTEMLR